MTPAARLAFARQRAHAVGQRERFERLAYHEAAHAAVAAYFGRDVESLHLGFDGYGSERGRCFADSDALPAFSRLIFLAAGAAAERGLGNEVVWDGDDHARAVAIVAAQFPDVRAAAGELELARREAERIVGDNWQIVAALASALIESDGCMSSGEVEPFLRDIPRAAPSRRSAPSPLADLQSRTRGIFGSRIVESTGPGGAIYSTTY